MSRSKSYSTAIGKRTFILEDSFDPVSANVWSAVPLGFSSCLITLRNVCTVLNDGSSRPREWHWEMHFSPDCLSRSKKHGATKLKKLHSILTTVCTQILLFSVCLSIRLGRRLKLYRPSCNCFLRVLVLHDTVDLLLVTGCYGTLTSAFTKLTGINPIPNRRRVWLTMPRSRRDVVWQLPALFWVSDKYNICQSAMWINQTVFVCLLYINRVFIIKIHL